MNSSKVQEEITKIVEQYRSKNGKFARKQYPASKTNITRAQTLGILEMIPNAPYSQTPGNSEIQLVIAAAENKETAVMNKFGEGETIGASALYLALNETDPMDEEFEAPLLDFATIS